MDLENEDVNLSSTICERFTTLESVLQSAAEDVLDFVTVQDFIDAYKKCFENIEKKDDIEKLTLRGRSREAMEFRKQFNGMVTRGLQESIQETLSAMDPKLKELEHLKNSQAGSSFVWRPPGDAREHIKLFDLVSKLEEKKELESKLEKIDEELSLLKTRLTQKRNKVIEHHESIRAATDGILQVVCRKVGKES